MTASLAISAQRGSARRKIFQPGEMRVQGAVSRVHLLDLSCTGALAYADAAPPEGTVVQLACPHPLGTARVVWARGKRSGVVFATPLKPDAVDAMLMGQPTLAASPSLVIR